MAADNAPIDTAPRSPLSAPRNWIAGLLIVAGLVSVAYAWQNQRPHEPMDTLQRADVLAPGTLASMDSPAVTYSDGWNITSAGAVPGEPVDPWLEPAGVFTFTYSGAELALDLAVGDYWAYVYATVDGQPASLLPYIRGNDDSSDAPAGYRTFYEPDKQMNGSPQAEWVRIHRDREDATTHKARVEIWRGWGQMPVRGIAVDALPKPSTPLWPGVALTLLGLALFVPSLRGATQRASQYGPVVRVRTLLSWLLLPALEPRIRLVVAAAFACGIAMGVSSSSWLLAVGGLAGLGVVSIGRPALWTAATVFSLPFYFSYSMPVMPGRAIGLIDAFVLLGLGVAFLHRYLAGVAESEYGNPTDRRHTLSILLAMLIAWALVSVTAAHHVDVALYEWRTVFLSAGLFAILLATSLRSPLSSRADLWLIVVAWIAGGLVVAALGLVQYVSGSMLIAAEGVHRIRAFYGSPNNLALYLERTFLVTLALGAFLPNGKARVAFAAAAAIQTVALVLTFSKGALLLGIPAGIVVLWLGGLILLPKQGRSRRPLLWLAAATVVIILILTPFLGTERFRGLLDFTQGTGYLRLQLWRSSWQMALDHLLLGVGPDNFLYAYRSTYLLPEAWPEPNLNHPHNWLLDWWTRIGHPGLVMAIALFAVGLTERWRTASGVAASRPAEAVLSLGFLAAGVAALTHGLIDASYALPDLMVSWVLILMAVIVLPARDNSNPTKS